MHPKHPVIASKEIFPKNNEFSDPVNFTLHKWRRLEEIPREVRSAIEMIIATVLLKHQSVFQSMVQVVSVY